MLSAVMAISLSSSTVGALFERMGEAGTLLIWGRTNLRDGGQLHSDLRSWADSYAPTASGDIQKEPQIAAYVNRVLITNQEAFAGEMQVLRTAMRETLRTQLWRDTNRFSPTDDSAAMHKLVLQELRRQMVAGSATVTTCTPGLTATAGSSNVGNGTLVTSTVRGDGLSAELMFAETGDLRIVKDGYARDGVQNHEEFVYTGEKAVGGTHPNWGETGYGSGASTRLRVIDPTANNARGNLLVNGFETFSSNLPAGWNFTVGTAGTDFQSSSAQSYFGSNSLQLIAGTGVLTSFEQSFGSAVAGYSTPAKLEGSTQYAVGYRYKTTGTVTAGVLTSELVTSGGSVTADDQSSNNSTTLTLSGASSSWQTKTATFRAPKNVASGVKIRHRISTALTGAPVFLDSLFFGKMVECYPGGPWVALIAGSTPFVRADNYQDHWTLAATNNNAGAASARATFHRLCDALWDLRLNGILLPSASGGASTVVDTDIA
jgi:hypothetical protein